MQKKTVELNIIPKEAFQKCFMQWKNGGLNVWKRKGITLNVFKVPI